MDHVKRPALPVHKLTKVFTAFKARTISTAIPNPLTVRPNQTPGNVQAGSSGYDFLHLHSKGGTGMADPVSLLHWDREGLETIICGALGGFFLCLGRFIATLNRMDTRRLRMKRFILAHIPGAIVLPLLGGGLAWVTMGAAGAFLAGLGALGFILIVTGPHPHANMETAATEIQEDDDVPASDKTG